MCRVGICRLGDWFNGMREKIISNIPSKKTGDIKDIYNAVHFIINSSYVNGSKINIDGGYTV